MNKIMLMAATVVGGCAAPAQEGAPMAAEPFAFAEDSSVIDFAYSYPGEAAAIPQLQARLQADFTTVRAEAFDSAQSDRASASDDERPYHRHYMHKSWTNLGQSNRLLSLVAQVESYSGGAHGITGFGTLLWDRATAAPIAFADLFIDQVSPVRLMGRDYCEALDAERLKRRQGERLEGQFGECPSFAQLSIAPADFNDDRRFETIRFLAGPYVAGPYVEGEYEVNLPVTAAVVAALKPEYRASFEAQPQ